MVDFFFNAYKDTSWTQIILEFVVFIFGILSVWYAGKENIRVYPTGLIATVISVYLLFLAGYLGEVVLNAYYSVMSLYGWYNWSKVDVNKQTLKITRTNTREKKIGVLIFLVTIAVVYGVYRIFDYDIHPENYIDMLTSGIFFTGMYFMALKKIENWTLWIIGDIISIPLYAYRGLGILSVQFIIFTALAIKAYLEWRTILEGEKLNKSNSE
ncbi:nicotinamide riboside transporter PnuC [Flavobacterium sp. NKUCC04_CG]|uniref:nicotinamide riboside transporter PnuC n=1 Tax=Flavobacterium sp. NKUCC04_CG TaxID=2842121 RepID=UPI001C5BBCD8|nr:nicotinamide riboside transporter PnuC [Flavobacterium sp. NKUCC04_CG]MBW3517846.1 nicotinamide riboside transporter PnuC [Flavobacterium sp. NKUCC04_CG]